MRWLLTTFLSVLLLYIPISVLAAEYTCDSCASCTGNISAAVPGDVIRVTADLVASETECINMTDTNGITLDCQSHSIDGSDFYTFGSTYCNRF